MALGNFSGPIAVGEYFQGHSHSFFSLPVRITGLQITPSATRWRINQDSALCGPHLLVSELVFGAPQAELCLSLNQLTLNKQGDCIGAISLKADSHVQTELKIPWKYSNIDTVSFFFSEVECNLG